MGSKVGRKGRGRWEGKGKEVENWEGRGEGVRTEGGSGKVRWAVKRWENAGKVGREVERQREK